MTQYSRTAISHDISYAVVHPGINAYIGVMQNIGGTYRSIFVDPVEAPYLKGPNTFEPTKSITVFFSKDLKTGMMYEAGTTLNPICDVIYGDDVHVKPYILGIAVQLSNSLPMRTPPA